MLYQILPRYDHQFQADTMRMFLKTLSGTKRRRSLRDRLSKLFDPNCILDYRFIIDCDGKDQTDGMISRSGETAHAVYDSTYPVYG